MPAYPKKVKVTSNGKDVYIYMCGDENLKYAVSLDGYTLLSDSSGWWYASSSAIGNIEKSPFRLLSEEDETEALKQFKQTCQKGFIPFTSEEEKKSRASAEHRSAVSAVPIVGERRALVVLMEFKDVSFKKTNGDFQALFNELNYSKDDATGSVRDFYRFASQGQFDYITDVYGPYTSKYNMRYYGENNTLGGSDSHAVELCREAMICLPKDLDYSVYDNDNDGYIDNVHIIFAGYGEEAGASSDAIWSHEYPHRISLKNEIGYSLAGYSCSPELRGNRGDKISNIGVVCHELGHALGAMDYYDTNYGTGGEYSGTGQWDIMASGSWNDDGRTPPNFNPYVRSEIFGWNKQEVLVSNQQIEMPRMEIDNSDQSIVYRLETESDGDYFLLENRQNYYFDAALPGEGLMVYHVHPNIEKYNRTNTINATHPQGMYPVCASYSEPTKKKYGNINSSECPFPGSRNVSSFSVSSSPAAFAWDGSSAKTSISQIVMNKSDGSINFKTSEGTIIEPEKPDIQTEKNLVYRESFESSAGGTISITSIFGKEKWRTYKKGNFVTNADLIPKANDGSGILMLFSGKDNAISESEAASPHIEVEAGQNYYLSFDIFCESISSQQTPVFTMYLEDKYGEYNIYSFKERMNRWNTIEIPLVFAGNEFKYKLYGRIQSGGIFIDNIRLYKEEDVTSLKPITVAAEQNNVYKVDGSFLGGHFNVSKNKIFILKKSDGSIQKVIAR